MNYENIALLGDAVEMDECIADSQFKFKDTKLDRSTLYTLRKRNLVEEGREMGVGTVWQLTDVAQDFLNHPVSSASKDCAAWIDDTDAPIGVLCSFDEGEVFVAGDVDGFSGQHIQTAFRHDLIDKHEARKGRGDTWIVNEERRHILEEIAGDEE